MDSESYLSTPKVAQKFDVTVDTVRVWIKEGKIRAVRVGRYWKVPMSEVTRLGEERHGGKEEFA